MVKVLIEVGAKVDVVNKVTSHTEMSRLLQACTGCHKVATRLCNVIASSPQACSTLLQGRCLVLTSLLQGRHNCLVLTGL